MSKGLVFTAGGLSAADKEKLIPENILTGIKIADVVGGLDILAWGELSYSGTERLYYWDGEKYDFITRRHTSDEYPRTCTVQGVFKKATYRTYGDNSRVEMYVSIGGNKAFTLTNPDGEFTTFTNSVIEMWQHSLAIVSLVVMGVKE